MKLFFIILYLIGVFHSFKGESLDGCPPVDPNCQPSCIEYTSDHCRYCRCTSSTGGSPGSMSNFGSSDWSSGSSNDQSWDTSISEKDWSSNVNANSDTWRSSDTTAGSNNENDANVKYIIVEKTPATYTDAENGEPRPFIGGHGGGPALPHISLPSLPFSSSSRQGSLTHSPGQGPFSSINSEYASSSIIQVPLISPGVPKYCVRCPILNCPAMCERTNEYGCRSCPCAPSRFQTMPVDRDCARNSHKKACTAIERCKQSCEDGYTIGEKDRDGCRTCSCIKYADRTTPKPREKGCPGTLSCMLKCKDGYILGDNLADGCPSCRCLPKGSKENQHSSNNNHNTSNGINNHNNNYHSNHNSNNNENGYDNTGNGFSQNGGSSTGSGDLYSGVSNGLGDGHCKPPMCLDGHMSVGEAMKIGASSAGTGVIDAGSHAGMTSSGGSTDSSNCYPMCAGGSGGGMTIGGSSSSGGGNGGSDGCSGPFCASIGGMSGGGGATSGGGAMMGAGGGGSMNGGGAMGGGTGMMGTGGGGSMNGGGAMGGRDGMMGGTGPGNKPFSPFAAALSGGDPGKGMSEHKDCSQLLHCMTTCDRYRLGELDETGCQTCSCQ